MLNRRQLMITAASGALAALYHPKGTGEAMAAETTPSGWRSFDVTTTVDLQGRPGPAQLWLPLIQSVDTYQRADAPVWKADQGQTALVKDPSSGATILRTQWDGDATGVLTMTQRVATRNRTATDFVAATPEELAREREGTASMPIDGIVKTTAMKIVEGRDRAEDRARAIYDWVIDNTFRDANVAGCGVGNVKNMLESGYFGGKCADISSLFVALARAAGLPARDVFGIRVADSRDFKSLGRSGDITKAQHCRAEVYLDGKGWMAVDPADVRKVVLEEKLPLDNPAVNAFREKAYGNWEMNWVGYNSARDFVLPGGTASQGFLMYPAAMTGLGEVDCLSPKTFAYNIVSKETAA